MDSLYPSVMLHLSLFRTLDLSESLSMYKLMNDAMYLNKLTKQIFAKYLDTYVQ